MNMNAQPTVEIVVGQATNMGARLYLQLAGSRASQQPERPWRLAGVVAGPHCRYARTLPARVPLRPATSRWPPVAEVVVPDPCFWTPQLPFLYRIQVELYDDERLVFRESILFGIRRLTVNGRNLMMDEKRYVIRGKVFATADVEHVQRLHDLGLAAFVTNPSDQLCAEASRCGVMLIADLTGCDTAKQAARANELSQRAAVGMVVLEPAGITELPAAANLPNGLIVAQRFTAGRRVGPSTEASAVIYKVETQGQAEEDLRDCRVPVIAVRRRHAEVAVDEARSACDRLQRDLAPQLDLAGYLVE